MINELSKYGNTELLSILIAELNDDGYYINQKGTKVYGIISHSIESVSIYNVDDEDPDYTISKSVNESVIMFFTEEGDDYLALVFVDEEYVVGSIDEHPWILPDMNSLGIYTDEKIRYESAFSTLENDREIMVHVHDRKEDRSFDITMEFNYDCLFSMIHGTSTVIKKEALEKKYPVEAEMES